jgi:hypothetical protein
MSRLDKTAKRSAFVALILVVATAAVLVGSRAIARSDSSSASGQPAAKTTTSGTGTWRVLPEAPFAVAVGRTSVWTGTEMIVSGGTAPDGNLLKSIDIAEAYNPAAHTWRRLASPPEMQNVCRRSAVWTGREMLVWGCSLVGFNPETNQWRRLPDPPTRQGIVAWTGHELIGWGGGCCGDADSGGSAYNPATKTWRKLARSPLAASQSPTGAWTGRELIMFVSGLDPEGKTIDGAARAAAYNPGTDTWRRISPLPEPSREGVAFWDGNEILVLGGTDARGVATSAVLAYRPTIDHWRRIASIESGRAQGVAVWTGDRLLLWGGEARTEGRVYEAQTNRWSPLPKSPLVERADPAGVWTGRELIVWGGVIGTPVGTSTPPRYLADGAAFTPRDTAGLRRFAARPSIPLPACC